MVWKVRGKLWTSFLQIRDTKDANRFQFEIRGKIFLYLLKRFDRRFRTQRCPRRFIMIISYSIASIEFDSDEFRARLSPCAAEFRYLYEASTGGGECVILKILFTSRLKKKNRISLDVKDVQNPRSIKQLHPAMPPSNLTFLYTLYIVCNRKRNEICE